MRHFVAPIGTTLILRSLNGGPLQIDDRICSACGRRFRHHHDGLACLVRAPEKGNAPIIQRGREDFHKEKG